MKLCSAAVPCFSIVSCLFQTSFSRGFTKNMKLEAVNPRNPAEICVASITSVKGRLMWLHLEGKCSKGCLCLSAALTHSLSHSLTIHSHSLTLLILSFILCTELLSSTFQFYTYWPVMFYEELHLPALSLGELQVPSPFHPHGLYYHDNNLVPAIIIHLYPLSSLVQLRFQQ